MKKHTWLGVWRDLDMGTRQQVARAAFERPALAKAAVLALARHDRVRRQTVERWSIDKRAEHFARIRRLPSSQLAGALLTNFHVVARGAMLRRFLDFIKVPHEDGVIKNIEEVEPPTQARLVAAIRGLNATQPKKHVRLFLDVLSCQSNFAVFAEIDEARRAALPPDEDLKKVARPSQTFGIGGFDSDLAESPTTASPAPPRADDSPSSFTTLDQVLVRTAIASVADVHGALPPDKVEDLVEEIIQLNLDRVQSYFHRGFLGALQGRPPALDVPEASDVRRAWTACGAIVGYDRQGHLDKVVQLLSERSDVAKELGRAGTGYAERVAPIVFEAFRREGRFSEAAGFLSPEGVGTAGPSFAGEVLDVAAGLISARREADARRLIEVLTAALPMLLEDPDLPADFEPLLQRLNAHCARLRGDFAGARQLLEQLLAASEPAAAADILADLGLVACGLRSLSDIRLPPEERLLPEFAAQFEKGWTFFERSSATGGGGLNHGDFCLGLALLARGEVDESLPYLERAVAGMSADPDNYGGFGPLDTARLGLSVALAEQADLARVPYARDLLRQVFAARARIPGYLLRRVLSAIELTAPEAAVELARETFETVGLRALPVLTETRLVRHLPQALDALLAEARRTERSPARRWTAAHDVLVESHAMRDSGLEDGTRIRERATEAFDVLVEVATAEEEQRQRLIEILARDNGPWRSAIDPLDARVVQAALYEADGAFPNAAAELSRAFHALLDVDDEWALGKAEALLEDIRAVGGDDAVAALEPRLKQYREVFERRSQSGLLVPPTVDPADFYGLVLVVGGNETQAAQDAQLVEEIRKDWPNVTVLFERTGWSYNWGEQLQRMEGELNRARVLVIMRYIRTMLGRALRKRANELELPWVSCTGSGRESMRRSIEEAILLAWRQSGVPLAGQ
jgi:tetratricopeptide (TPR) repeat protein